MKRVIIILICVLMCVSVVGCGQTTATKTVEAVQETQTPEATPEETKAPEATPEEAVFGEKTTKESAYGMTFEIPEGAERSDSDTSVSFELFDGVDFVGLIMISQPSYTKVTSEEMKTAVEEPAALNALIESWGFADYEVKELAIDGIETVTATGKAGTNNTIMTSSMFISNNYLYHITYGAITGYETVVAPVMEEFIASIKVGAPENVPEPPQQPTFGETFTFDSFEITFIEPYSFTTVENRYSDNNGDAVVGVPVKIKNVGTETNSLNMFYYHVFGSKGTTLDNVSSYFDNSLQYAGEMRPASELEAVLYFLYDGDGDYYVSFDNHSEEIEANLPIVKNAD